MTDLQKASFFPQMVLAVKQAGMIAKAFQGKVENEGKKVDGFETDSEVLKQKRAAKTLIDEVVQEIILLAALEVLDPSEVVLDAEENTPSVALFPNTNAEMSLIIDPIDGTHEYLQGLDSYSVCVGLVHNGELEIALVYYPVRDILYFIGDDNKSYVAQGFSHKGLAASQLLRLDDSQLKKTIFKNSRVDEEIVQNFEKTGYQVLDDTLYDIGCPDAILKSVAGESQAYIAHSRQMKDILQGAIIGKAQGGFMSDWQGQDLKWAKTGRLPEAVFGVRKTQVEILKLLQR